MKIPTAHSTESLERFLRHIQSAPVPTVVNRPYLKESGFTSGNDPELRHIFRLLGFLDDEDLPQLRWKAYKEAGTEVLQEAIYECYKGLFDLLPDAPYTKSDHELSVWFHPPLTGDTRSSVERAVRTFRKLCQLADITHDNFRKNTSSPLPTAETTHQPPVVTLRGSGKTTPLILNLPSFTDKADYLPLFEALKEVFYE